MRRNRSDSGTTLLVRRSITWYGRRRLWKSQRDWESPMSRWRNYAGVLACQRLHAGIGSGSKWANRSRCRCCRVRRRGCPSCCGSGEQSLAPPPNRRQRTSQRGWTRQPEAGPFGIGPFPLSTLPVISHTLFVRVSSKKPVAPKFHLFVPDAMAFPHTFSVRQHPACLCLE